jgi:aromatic ring hydroxylase
MRGKFRNFRHRSGTGGNGRRRDTALSDFAGRQELYEYYFFGEPVRMAGALVQSYDRQPYKDRVQEFLHRTE